MIRAAVAALLFAAIVLPTATTVPTPAAAQVTVSVEIGRGTQLSGRRRITCSEGASLLRRRGFQNISRVDCRGRYFVYRASRRSWRYEIAISSRDGQVVDFRRLHRR